jgi:hypothetical protein
MGYWGDGLTEREVLGTLEASKMLQAVDWAATEISQSQCFSRTVKMGDVIPDMGNCKELDRAVQDYKRAESDTVATESQEESIITAAGMSLSEIKKDAATTLGNRR